MKKHTLLSIYFLFIFLSTTQAQFNWVKQWDHSYGGTGGDYVIAFKETTHHGYIMAGKTASDSSGNKSTHMIGNGAFDYWVVKVDSLGNMIWEKNFGGTGNDVFWAMDLTSDGGCILGGSSDSPIGNDKSEACRGDIDYWIVKLDSTGHRQWDRTFGGSADDDLRSVKQTADGGYILGGESRSPISGDKTQQHYGIGDYWIIKTNPQGIKTYDKVFGGTEYDHFVGLTQTSDHGFVFAGQSKSPVSGTKTVPTQGGLDYYLVKTDSIGIMQWDKSYGGNADDYIQAFESTDDGGFLCGGWSMSGISGDKTQALNGGYDLWILKLTAGGVVQWDKDFGGIGNEDEFTSIYQMNDKGYLLGATSYSNAGADKTDNNLGVEQPWIIRTDSLGNKMWDKTVFTNGHNENGLTQMDAEQKCFVIVSGDNGAHGGDKSEDAFQNSSDYWIVKFCEGEPTGIDSLELFENNLNVYPNPFTNEIRIDLGNEAADMHVSLFDACGRLVIEKKMNSSDVISTSDLSHGFYFVRVVIGGHTLMRKMIK